MAAKLFLYTKWSERHANPPVERVRQVLEEVYDPATEVSDEELEEHPNAWLEYVAAERIYFAITDRGADEAEHLYRMDDVPQARAMELWMWLFNGDLSKVRAQPWAETRSDGGDELQSAGWA